MLKPFSAVIAGLFLAMCGVMLTDYGMNYFFIPKGLKLNTIKEVEAFFAKAPVTLYLFQMSAYALSAFLGTMVTALIAKKLRTARITALVFLLPCLANYILLPHPFWTLLSGSTLIALFGFAAATLFSPKQAQQ